MHCSSGLACVAHWTPGPLGGDRLCVSDILWCPTMSLHLHLIQPWQGKWLTSPSEWTLMCGSLAFWLCYPLTCLKWVQGFNCFLYVCIKCCAWFGFRGVVMLLFQWDCLILFASCLLRCGKVLQYHILCVCLWDRSKFFLCRSRLESCFSKENVSAW